MNPLTQSFDNLEAQAATWDEAEAGDTITINGNTYLAAITPGRKEQVETLKGHEWHETMRIDIRKILLPEAPVRDTTITYNGHAWKVRTHYPDAPRSQQWAFQCTRRVGT